jgi:predicted nucleotide-binding protein
MRQGIDRLNKCLARIRAFEPTSVTDQHNIPHVAALSAAVDDALVRTFGADTLDYKRYCDAAYFDNGPINYAYRVPIEKVQESLGRSKAKSIALLTEAIVALEGRLSERSGASPSLKTAPAPQKAVERKVFVVHGHDEVAKVTVARFLEAIGFEAIILHEQTNRGRTIIEKFEAHSDVGFAVILLTPDDHGAGAEQKESRPRARQNVIMEWGYFIARLGRSHVCALRKGDVELPSDIDGIVWEPFDQHGAWKQKLANELEDAGFEIDYQKAARA